MVSDSTDALFATGTTFNLGSGASLTIAAARNGPHGRIVAFQEVEDRSAAEVLRGETLYVERSRRRPLQEGEYWPDDLIGLRAVDPDGVELGTVVDVTLRPSQDLLVIATSGGRVEVPFVDPLVPAVDLAVRRIVVVPIPGLFTAAE